MSSTSSSAHLGAGQSDVYADVVDVGESIAGRSEWDDALIKHGIKQAEKQGITEDDLTQQRHEDQQQLAATATDRLSLEEAEELEDELDDRVLDQLRQQRLQQLKEQQSRPVFGTLKEIRGDEFVASVTNASKLYPVVCHLYSPDQPVCALLNQLLSTLAASYPHTSFVTILGRDAIPNYPNHLTPTLLFYNKGDLQHQAPALREWGGEKGLIALLFKYKMIDRTSSNTSGSRRSTETRNAITEKKVLDSDSDEEEDDDDV